METQPAEPGGPGGTIGSWFWVRSSADNVCSAARLVEVLGAEVGQNGSLNPDASCVVEFLHGGYAEVRYSEIGGAVDVSILKVRLSAQRQLDVLTLGLHHAHPHGHHKTTEAMLRHRQVLCLSRFPLGCR